MLLCKYTRYYQCYNNKYTFVLVVTLCFAFIVYFLLCRYDSDIFSKYGNYCIKLSLIHFPEMLWRKERRRERERLSHHKETAVLVGISKSNEKQVKETIKHLLSILILVS